MSSDHFWEVVKIFERQMGRRASRGEIGFIRDTYKCGYEHGRTEGTKEAINLIRKELANARSNTGANK
ncbi:hypothetical protein PIL02S_03414 [Paenibacillus illinoisensis]|uniref:Uncharacterized protein n=1 Tax=Paenibacillus illinoisensis TaxID=59845 RepID=A0A2W0CKB6_9BACL|nr:hypothetical protein PIL02S_03414 [Paenibacillus illinoisensis]